MSYLVLKRGMSLSRSIDDYPDGIVIPVDKPWRWTSADVIRKVKWMAIKHFQKRNLKIGHAGTLDPLATGVLLVCVGKATKLSEELQKQPKQYLAGVTFGAATASYDREKEVDSFFPSDGVSRDALQAVLPSFLGEQDQVAPLFSAKSVDGVRMYELARKRYKAGLPVEEPGLLQASHITIYDLKLESGQRRQRQDQRSRGALRPSSGGDSRGLLERNLYTRPGAGPWRGPWQRSVPSQPPKNPQRRIRSGRRPGHSRYRSRIHQGHLPKPPGWQLSFYNTIVYAICWSLKTGPAYCVKRYLSKSCPPAQKRRGTQPG